jgi:hypothetical protein
VNLQFEKSISGCALMKFCMVSCFACSSTEYRRDLKLKANIESSFSYFSFRRLVPGAVSVGLIGSTRGSRRFQRRFDRVNLHRIDAFNVALIGSTCTALALSTWVLIG